MQTTFKDNKSNELIVLFDGWGMDEKPYSQLESSMDILFVHDYTNLNLNFDSSNDFDFNKYKKTYLITFSAGVFMSKYLKDILPEFDLKIAINGTLFPLDEKRGIPKNILAKMENITLENALDFRGKLIPNITHLRQFNRFQPARDLQSSQDELTALKKYFSCPIHNSDFDKIIIGKNDKIIPLENQLKAWEGHKNLHIIDGGHFLFYNFSSFDEIINL